MTESNDLCDPWEHTIVKVFKHDSKSKLGLMFKQWINFNKLGIELPHWWFYTIWKFVLHEWTWWYFALYTNEKIFNLRWYIQHLMDESEDEAQNPLSGENWMKQNNGKFIKFVIHHRHPMTPEQLKQKPFEEKRNPLYSFIIYNFL